MAREASSSIRWPLVAAAVVGVLGSLVLGYLSIGLVTWLFVSPVEQRAILVVLMGLVVLAAMLAVVAAVRSLLQGGRDAAVADPGRGRHGDRVVSAALHATAALVLVGTLVCTSGHDMAIGLLPMFVAAGWTIVASSAALTGRRRMLGAFAAVSVAAVVLGLSGAASWLRIKASETEVAEAGRSVLTGEEPTRAGTYGFVSSWVDHQGCAVMVTQTMMIDEYGVAYCPTPPPADDGRFTHRSGELYEYSYVD